jgi:uncharacterized surface protein with fasciclin (FAS1) repeats
MNTKVWVGILLAASLVLGACAASTPEATEVPDPTAMPEPIATPEPTPEPEPGDIVSIAVGDGRFETLVAAVQAAGLENALRGEGPLTVFAPTDEAFAALPDGTVESLLAEPEALSQILLYHVVEGQVMAEDVIRLNQAQTLQGQYVDISVEGGEVMIDDAQVLIADIQVSNGVIHVIDRVILPESRDIVDIAAEDGRFETLVAAVQAAGLENALRGEGPLTVFAPTDEAFNALPEGTVEALLGDIPQLTDILLYHVTEGRVMASDILALAGDPLATLSGEDAMVAVSDGQVMIGDAQVIITNIEASNGVIHVIDAVLLPPA